MFCVGPRPVGDVVVQSLFVFCVGPRSDGDVLVSVVVRVLCRASARWRRSCISGCLCLCRASARWRRSSSMVR